MNINALRDQEADLVGIYGAACGPQGSTGWPGCSIYSSRDAGTNYSFLATLTAPSIIGITGSTLLAWTGHLGTLDTVNYVDVSVNNGTLSSITYDQLLDGGNACVIGEEIIGFMTATLLSANTYRLRNLLRGLRGTDYAMGSHYFSERFIYLDPAAMKFIALETSDIGKSFWMKGVTNGATVASATAQTFTFLGATLLPYPPCNPNGIRDASNNCLIRWDRRNRKQGEWRDYVDVPMSEATESYEIDVYSSSAYTTIKRTITVAGVREVTYTAAQQVTDFGSAQATLYIKIYQMSATVGRGRPLKATI